MPSTHFVVLRVTVVYLFCSIINVVLLSSFQSSAAIKLLIMAYSVHWSFLRMILTRIRNSSIENYNRSIKVYKIATIMMSRQRLKMCELLMSRADVCVHCAMMPLLPGHYSLPYCGFKHYPCQYNITWPWRSYQQNIY